MQYKGRIKYVCMAKIRGDDGSWVMTAPEVMTAARGMTASGVMTAPWVVTGCGVRTAPWVVMVHRGMMAEVGCTAFG